MNFKKVIVNYLFLFTFFIYLLIYFLYIMNIIINIQIFLSIHFILLISNVNLNLSTQRYSNNKFYLM